MILPAKKQADELISLIVLWIAITASVAAARSDRHLRIDALSHFVPQKYACIPRVIVDAFASGLCLFLGWHSFRYILLTREFEDTVLTNVPAWIAFAIVPIAFTLMAYRFLLLSGKGLLHVQSGNHEAEVDQS